MAAHKVEKLVHRLSNRAPSTSIPEMRTKWFVVIFCVSRSCTTPKLRLHEGGHGIPAKHGQDIHDMVRHRRDTGWPETRVPLAEALDAGVHPCAVRPRRRTEGAPRG